MQSVIERREELKAEIGFSIISVNFQFQKQQEKLIISFSHKGGLKSFLFWEYGTFLVSGRG